MLLDLLLPQRCPACRRVSAEPLCPGCMDEAERLVLADRAAVGLAPGVQAIGLYAYDGAVRDAIRTMKASGGHASAGPLGEHMRDRLGLPEPGRGVALTWVPASRRRRRLRGSDIPELLAGPTAVPLLARVAERPDQTLLDPAARRASPAGSFRATGLVPPAVVLIDDVRTTGATASAAASALRKGGASRVLVATLAVAGSAHAGLV